MKKIIFSTLCILFSINLFSTNDSEKLKIVVKKDSLINETRLKSDTERKITQNDAIDYKTVVEVNDKKTNVFEFIFPSLIAILISLIAFIGNLIVIRKQIESSKSLIDKQIQTAKETADLTFRQNVLSSNRRDWIENLRNKVCLLGSEMLVLALSKEKGIKDFGKILELTAYTELMLNPNDKRDNELIIELQEIPQLILHYPDDTTAEDLGKYRRKILDLTKVILKSEWERVKKGE